MPRHREQIKVIVTQQAHFCYTHSSAVICLQKLDANRHDKTRTIVIKLL